MDPLEKEYKRIQQEQEKEKKRQAERDARERELASIQASIDYNDQLIKHQRKYQCQIGNCPNTSSGPTKWDISSSSSPYAKWVDNWEDPKGIEKCRMCGKFACSKKHFIYDKSESPGPNSSYNNEGRVEDSGICMECYVKTKGAAFPLSDRVSSFERPRAKTPLIILCSLVLIVIVIAVAAIGTVHNQTVSTSVPTPLQQVGSFNITVSATQDLPGVNSGINLQAGQHISITATGLAEYGVDTKFNCNCGNSVSPSTDPDGNRTLNGQLCQPNTIIDQGVLASAPIGTLLGSYGQSGNWFVIGSSYSGDVPVGGELYLIYNDIPGEFDTNSGSYKVTIIVS